MNLFKRCDCADPVKCRHPFWFLFRLRRQRYEESTRTANRQLALSIAQKRRIAALETREGFRPVKPVRLSEHVTAYVAHPTQTNRSSNKDRPVLDGLMASVGADRFLTDVSAFHVERWKRERAAVVSQSTVNRELNIVRGCFSRAVEWGRLGASPLRRVKMYRVDNVRLRVASPEEIQALLAGASPDLALLSRLTLESLLRLSEALALRREDIGPMSVTVIHSKSGRARQVPLTATTRAALLARCHASGFVFGLGKSGKPPNAAAISVAFSRLTTALGLTGVSHHTLRHTGATVMVRQGVSLRAVQTIGGWSSLRMLERYAHVNDAELARAVEVTHAHTDAAIQAPTKTPTVAEHPRSGKAAK
jgi:integrase